MPWYGQDQCVINALLKYARLNAIIKEDMAERPWNIEAVAKALKTEAEDCFDTLQGRGRVLPLVKSPEQIKPALALYQERLVARYHSPLFCLDIAHVNAITAEDGRVRVEASTEKSRAVAYFDAQGSMIFNVTTNGKEEKPNADVVQEAPKPDPKVDIKEDEKKDRVTLTGRVGKDPEVKDTKNGKKMLKLPIAVKDDEETKWYNVFFFGDKAEAMAEKVTKGKLVTVIGYIHETEQTVKGPNGPMKKKSEVIYGAAIQDPNKKRTDTHDFKHSYPKP